MTKLTSDGAVYRQHEASFSSVSAYVVLFNGDRVATIAIKFPRDGAGRLYAYVHWIGVPMVRGQAGGGGYDKRSAACANAARKLPETSTEYEGHPAAYAVFRDTLARDDGYSWDRRLTDAGFTVFQAV